MRINQPAPKVLYLHGKRVISSHDCVRFAEAVLDRLGMSQGVRE